MFMLKQYVNSHHASLRASLIVLAMMWSTCNLILIDYNSTDTAALCISLQIIAQDVE